MLNRNRWIAGALAIAVVAILGYTIAPWPSSADSRAMVLPMDSTPLVAETDKGERSFSIEVADDESEREKGLMYRQSLPDDHGMLFVFEETREVGFWMKDTPLALDLIFIGQDGLIRAIRQGEPLSPAVISPGEPVRFVLELKAGTAAKSGIEDGDRVRHPEIDGVAGSGGQGNAG